MRDAGACSDLLWPKTISSFSAANFAITRPAMHNMIPRSSSTNKWLQSGMLLSPRRSFLHLSQFGSIPQKDSSSDRKYAVIIPITRLTVIIVTFLLNDTLLTHGPCRSGLQYVCPFCLVQACLSTFPLPTPVGSQANIWNREQHYRNRDFSMYWYVQVRTGTYRYRMYNSTDQYIPVCTKYVPE